MGIMKAQEIQQENIVRLESEMNNLWGELNTFNVPQSVRVGLEQQLAQCEELFKTVLGGNSSIYDLEKHLNHCDKELALAVIRQAENEIPKIEREGSVFLALKNIHQELENQQLTPIKARHEVKRIMRHKV